ncbi:MAG TPA: RdgB/HAM1 family non-canonical purine NTP pyrophosphatase [Candidatus Saccharimonadales bacterium]
MKALTLITSNAGKAKEFELLLGVTVHHQKVELPEVQATAVAKVAKAKAEAAYQALQKPVLVDDTGLYINAWGELPGALIAWFLDNIGNEGILKMLEGWGDRSARVMTALGYCDENGSQVFIGELAGSIAKVARGKNGFGYDSIFIPEGQPKTFAEMTSQEKNAISMRAQAAHYFREAIL